MIAIRARDLSLALVLASLASPAALAVASQSAARIEQPARGGAGDLVAEGLRLLRARQLAEAEPVLQQAVERAEAEGNLVAKGNALWGLGSVRGAAGDLEGRRRFDALAEEAFEAAGSASDLGTFLNSRAVEAYARGELDTAEAMWKRALDAFARAGSPGDRANVLRNLTFLPRFSTEEKLARMDEALVLARQASRAGVEGAILHQIADLQFILGDLRSASASLAGALPLLDAPDTRVNHARALISLARVQRAQGDAASAQDEGARAIAELEGTGDFDGAAYATVALAIACTELGLAADAVAATERAVALARKGGRPATIGAVLVQHAQQLLLVRRPSDALAMLDEAASFPAPDTSTSMLLATKAEVLLTLDRVPAALDEIDKAIAMSTGLARDLQFHQHYLRARVLDRLGRAGDAIASSERSLSVIEGFRRQLVPDDHFKRAFAERVRDQYALYVDLLARQGRMEEALQASERARARALLDLLVSRVQRAGAQRPAEPAPAQPFGAGGSGITPGAGVPGGDPPVPAAPAIVLRGARPGPATVRTRDLESAVSAEPPAMDGIRGVAARLQGHLLVYWVNAGETLAWVVAPDGRLTSRRLPIRQSELDRLVRSSWVLPGTTRGTSAQDDGATGARLPADSSPGTLAVDDKARRTSRALYDLLIAPVRSSLPTRRDALVTIVPHGVLHRLSFAGLISPGGRYLLEDLRLSYAPSLGTLEITMARAAVPPASRVVVVADPRVTREVSRVDGLAPLPGAAAEGRAVAREAASRGTPVLLTGADATERRVLTEAATARVLHFATHAVVRDDRPFDSFLALAGAPGPDAAEEADGRLTTSEVYGLDLQAEIVVLSACHSASGPVTGDGMVGLTRAFFSAGSPTVVASLWDLPDATTSRVLPAFYRQWTATGSKAEALRRAQLRLLADLRAGRVSVETPAGRFVLPEHPAVWAGLVLVGAP
jgi:CHAT domain-containing protein/tetratricopeptide (TPR) repeat protein